MGPMNGGDPPPAWPPVAPTAVRDEATWPSWPSTWN